MKNRSPSPLIGLQFLFLEDWLPQSALPTKYAEAAPHGGLSHLCQ